MSISTHPEAQIPAKMGLFVMWFHMLVSEFTSGLDPSEETDLNGLSDWDSDLDSIYSCPMALRTHFGKYDGFLDSSWGKTPKHALLLLT